MGNIAPKAERIIVLAAMAEAANIRYASIIYEERHQLCSSVGSNKGHT